MVESGIGEILFLALCVYVSMIAAMQAKRASVMRRKRRRKRR